MSEYHKIQTLYLRDPVRRLILLLVLCACGSPTEPKLCVYYLDDPHDLVVAQERVTELLDSIVDNVEWWECEAGIEIRWRNG